MAEQPDHPTFARWLKRRRQELDLTQERLAELVGYASPTIQKVERGERRPSRDLVARLAEALAIPPGERDAFARLARGPADAAQPAPPAPSPPPAPAQPFALPLLRARVQPPPARRSAVARPRLLGQRALDDAEAVTLVVAPAGWGKTTLLSGWIAALPPEEQRRVAWLALDAGDGDPLRLLRYVIAALQRADGRLGVAALALLDAPQPALDAALALLANDLAELDRPLALVLDDYHLLRARATHQVVAFLVDHPPPQLRLLIATRETPPLPLGRLRARGQLREIRAADLRFTPEEAAGLLNDAMGLALDAPAVAALAARTEGWAAGLQLAALALRDQGDRAGFIQRFVGGHRLVLDYLADEVLDRLPAHLHTFLLQTSILERLCGPLCDAVLGLGNEDRRLEIVGRGAAPDLQSPASNQAYSQLLLNDLEHASLFLVPLDETQTWYRYHHLFGEVLRVRLGRGAAPAAVMALHARAASWYAAHGLWHDALTHAQAARRWDVAAQALERVGDELLLQGAFERLGGLLDALPQEARDSHPRLLLLQGICAYRSYNLPAAHELLARSADAFGRAGDVAGRGEALLHLSDSQRSSGDFAAAHAALHEALAAPLPPRARVNALISRTYETIAAGDAAAARAAWDAALEIGLAHDDPWLRFELAINAHSIVLVLPGLAEWGERLCQSAQLWGVPDPSPMAAALAWVRGYTRLLRGDLDAAGASIGRAMEISAQLGGIPKLILDAGFQQGLVALLRGDLAQAERFLAASLELLARPESAAYDRTFGALHRCHLVWLRFAQGRPDEARAVAAEIEAAASPHEWPAAHCVRLILRGALAAEAGDTGAAEQLLGAAAREQARFADAFILGDARMHLAGALLRAGRPQAALAPLAEALDDQARRGTPGVLLMAAAPDAAALLRLARDHGRHPETAARLLTGLGAAAPEAPPASPPPEPAGPDALSAREREVLRLLAGGAGNQAIADALVISAHTAKHHVASILAKLGAANRTEAVARARALGLL